MLRTRPAITAAEGVKSTATYTDVPKFGFRAARLTVVFIASGDRRAGRFWGSITCFIFPPGAGRWRRGFLMSYVLVLTNRCSRRGGPRPRQNIPAFLDQG